MFIACADVQSLGLANRIARYRIRLIDTSKQITKTRLKRVFVLSVAGYN